MYVALSTDAALNVIKDCFRSLHSWLDANGLCLNPDKSEALVIGTTSRHRHDAQVSVVTLSDVTIPVATSVRSLGVTIDNTLSFNDHVGNICKSAYYHIRALRHIRRCVSVDDAKSVAAAMVSARLDYCNALLRGMTVANINRLQRVQNALARSVMGIPRRQHITPVLAELHWLPVTARIDFKIALLTFKTLSTHQPAYLDELLHLHRPSRHTRSSEHNVLSVLRARTAFGQRRFSCTAPTVWNSLPYSITDDLNVSLPTFKSKLKTFLYSRSYP